MKSFVIVLSLICGITANAADFSQIIGNVKVGPVKKQEYTNVGYYTWGGDVATFLANGGLKTQPGSIYDDLGLKLNLNSGDNFPQQVKDYLEGNTPYLRLTTGQMGLVSEVLNKNESTKPVILYQLTWSVGDHIVASPQTKTITDFKGKRIALQEFGPHLDLLDNALRAAGLTWADITPVWCPNLTGENSPSVKLREGLADAACVITPDMLGLTGGLDSKGTGAEGTLKDYHVVLSTAQMSRSICDVYLCRKDYFDSNQIDVQKFFAGYLRATELLISEQKKYDDGKGSSKIYLDALKLAQSIYGEEVLPTVEIDAHGLVLDADFVRLPGNISFFTDKGNISGFESKQAKSIDLALSLGFVKNRFGCQMPNFDYKAIATLAGIDYVEPTISSGKFQGEIESFADDEDNKILSFMIQFEPNQDTFSADVNGAEFQRVIENASVFGKAVFVVRGHSDPTATIRSFLKAGIEKGVISKVGNNQVGYKYYLANNKELDLTQTDNLVKLMQNGSFVGASEDPNQTFQVALNLSLSRAEAVKKSIVEFAKRSGVNLDESQIQPQGVGIREPIFPKPTNMEEAKKNMRVEFILKKVPAELFSEQDFDF